jgi:hypothetical protein
MERTMIQTLRERWNALDAVERLLVAAAAFMALRWLVAKVGERAGGWFWMAFGLAWAWKYIWF